MTLFHGALFELKWITIPNTPHTAVKDGLFFNRASPSKCSRHERKEALKHLIQSTNNRWTQNSAYHLPRTYYPPLSLMFTIFLSFIFSLLFPLIPRSHFAGPRLLPPQPFLPLYPGAISFTRSLYLFLWISLKPSEHPLLFQNSHCNGSNVKEKSPAASPLVSFSIKRFDQSVTPACVRDSALQLCARPILQMLSANC